MPDKHRARLASLTARGMMRKLKTARAWSIKESLRDMWKCRSRVEAETHWRWWYGWAIRSRLSPVKKVAAMLKEHLPGVLAYFRHRVTNAASEGLNAKIQRIKKMAYGFRNREHFKTAIATARGQGALLFELRATTRLAELLATQGRGPEAVSRLGAVYVSFTEGHRGPDLRAAKELLDRLSTR